MEIYSLGRLSGPEPVKTGKKKTVLWIVIILALGFVSWELFLKSEDLSAEKTEKPVFPEEAMIAGAEMTEEDVWEKKEDYMVSEGDIPAEIFSRLGKFDANDMEALLAAADGVYDFTNLKIGQKITFYSDGDDRAGKVEYNRSTEKMVIVEREGDSFLVREESVPYAVSVETATGIIDNFFYADALEAGLSEPTVLEVGDLFSFSIDFTTEIRQGDEFSFVYEKRTLDGQEAPDGRILAAKFVNDGTPYYAYYFENDGQGGHYDEEGRVLEKQFLRAPLSYRRITSGFTGARLHPITRTVTAHYQIDYAAPTGTPVVATARGTVTGAGWEGGWGNIVRLRHDNGYVTHYGHLSKFAKDIRPGTRVSQGQVIGYVGSTGWSTGPHLDYGMKLNGAPVNPLKLQLPKGEPLGEKEMEKFEEIKRKYQGLLDS